MHNTNKFTNPRIIKSKKLGYDSIIGVDAGQKEGGTIAIFEPEQIHILGSKQDIEGFKEFVDKPIFDKELAKKIQDKLEKLKDKEVKALLFDKYLRETNNAKAGNQAITGFFKKNI